MKESWNTPINGFETLTDKKTVALFWKSIYDPLSKVCCRQTVAAKYLFLLLNLQFPLLHVGLCWPFFVKMYFPQFFVWKTTYSILVEYYIFFQVENLLQKWWLEQKKQMYTQLH